MTNKEIKYLILIILIFIAACIETDIYLPAFPNMMKFFSISEKNIQSLLTWNFVGICISGPLYGPLSDSYGRKTPLMIALGFFLIGSIITCITNNFKIMLLGRILQGLGSGGCFTLGTAIIFDTFQKERAVIAISQLNTIVPVIMAGAPLLGGYLNNKFGFRSNFIFILLLIILSFFICLFYYEETLKKQSRNKFDIKQLIQDFKRVFLCVPFWEATLIMSLLFGGYLAFVSGTVVLFVIEMGISKNLFPFFQVALLGSYVLGSLTYNKALKKFGSQNLKKWAITMIIFGVLGLNLIFLTYPKNPFLLNSIMMFYSFGCSWLMAPYFGESMELMPEIKGIAASILTSIRLFLTAFIIDLSGKFYNKSIFPLVILINFILVIILPMIFHYEKNKNS